MTAAALCPVDGVYPSNAAGRYYFAAPLDPDDQGVQGVRYAFDWAAWLAGSGTSLSSGTVTATGLTISNAVPNGSLMEFWAQVSTATPGQDVAVECNIVDSDGQPQTRTGFIRVRQK